MINETQNRIEPFINRRKGSKIMDKIFDVCPNIYTRMEQQFKDRKRLPVPYKYNENYVDDMLKKFDDGYILYENDEITGVVFLCSFLGSLDVTINVISDNRTRIIKLLIRAIESCRNKNIYDIIAYLTPYDELINIYKSCGFEEVIDMDDGNEILSKKLILKLK